jgi:UDP-N-acetylmuramoyl-tripeptide--D-alanyl-D-alanine ligase
MSNKFMKLINETKALNYKTDSRLVVKGDVFLALKGEQMDGHRFLQDAKNNGAEVAIVSKDYSGDSFGLSLICVDNVYKTMIDLAKQKIKKQKPKIIAITGSVGKTTTKDFISKMLDEKYVTGKTYQNYNTIVGMCLSILNMDGFEDVFVLEMGIRKKNDIDKLIEIANPDICVLTKIAHSHSENFENGLDDIFEEKARIFSHSKTKLAIVNHEITKKNDFENFCKCKFLTYSIYDRSANYFMKKNGNFFTILENNKVIIDELFIPFTEEHLLENVLTSIAMSRVFLLDEKQIKMGARRLTYSTMRYEKIEKDGVLYISDCYNANPASMSAALKNMPDIKGKKIAVLGSMLGLGKYSKEAHIEIGKLASIYIDYLLCIGKESKDLYHAFLENNKNARYLENRDDLFSHLKTIIKKDDCVLIKGSRNHHLEKIVENFT